MYSILHNVNAVSGIATKDFVDSKISESKAEIIKWMFVFVFSSTILTIGSILAILKFFVSK